MSYIHSQIIIVSCGDAGLGGKEVRHKEKQPRETTNILESVRLHTVYGEMNSVEERVGEEVKLEGSQQDEKYLNGSIAVGVGMEIDLLMSVA